MRFLRRTSPAVLVVKLPDGLQLAVPEWMLSPLACEQLKEEKEPRIATAALQELRELGRYPIFVRLPAQEPLYAESPPGGPHAQQSECGLSPEKPAFEIDRVWVALPEQVRESCRSLCRELLMTVLKKSERRQNERKD